MKNKKILIIIVSFISLIILSLFAYLYFFQEKQVFGKVIELTGDVEALKGNSTTSIKAFSNMSFIEGDTITTLNDGKVNLALSNRKTVYVAPDTKVVFTELVESIRAKGGKSYLNLYEGKVIVDIDEKLKGDSRFQIETSNAIMGVMGTEFIVYFDGKGTWVIVLEGEVEVTKDQERIVLVPDNKRVYIGEDGSVEVSDIDEEQLTELLQDFLIKEQGTLSSLTPERLAAIGELQANNPINSEDDDTDKTSEIVSEPNENESDGGSTIVQNPINNTPSTGGFVQTPSTPSTSPPINEVITINKEQLQSAISIANNLQIPPSDTQAYLDEILGKAENINLTNSVTQTEIDAITLQLQQAIQKVYEELNEIAQNKEQLLALIYQARAIESPLTNDYSNMVALINNTELLYNDPLTTLNSLTKAKEDLQLAISIVQQELSIIAELKGQLSKVLVRAKDIISPNSEIYQKLLREMTASTDLINNTKTFAADISNQIPIVEGLIQLVLEEIEQTIVTKNATQQLIEQASSLIFIPTSNYQSLQDILNKAQNIVISSDSTLTDVEQVKHDLERIISIVQQEIARYEEAKQLLEQAINQGVQVTFYASAEYDTLQNVLTDATTVLSNNNSLLEDIITITAQIELAIQALQQKITIDLENAKQLLLAYISDALQLEIIESANYDLLQTEVQRANDIIDSQNVQISEINAMIISIEQLIASVKIEIADLKYQLKQEISNLISASQQLELISSVNYDLLQNKIQTGNMLVQNNFVTIVELQQNIIELTALIDVVKEDIRSQKVILKQQLEQVIGEAQALEIIQSANYNALLTEIQAANTLIQTDSTIDELTQKITNLNVLIDLVEVEINQYKVQLKIELTALIEQATHLEELATGSYQDLQVAIQETNILLQAAPTIIELHQQLEELSSLIELVELEIAQQKMQLKQTLLQLVAQAAQLEQLTTGSYQDLQIAVQVANTLIQDEATITELQQKVNDIMLLITAVELEIEQFKTQLIQAMTQLIEEAEQLEIINSPSYADLQIELNSANNLIQNEATIEQLQQKIDTLQLLIVQVKEEITFIKIEMKQQLNELAAKIETLEMISTSSYAALQAELPIIQTVVQNSSVTIYELEQVIIEVLALIEAVESEIIELKAERKQQLTQLATSASSLEHMTTNTFEQLQMELVLVEDLLQNDNATLEQLAGKLTQLTMLIEEVEQEINIYKTQLKEQLEQTITSISTIEFISGTTYEMLQQQLQTAIELIQSSSTIVQLEQQIEAIHTLQQAVEAEVVAYKLQLKQTLQQLIGNASNLEVISSTNYEQLQNDLQIMNILIQEQSVFISELEHAITELEALISVVQSEINESKRMLINELQQLLTEATNLEEIISGNYDALQLEIVHVTDLVQTPSATISELQNKILQFENIISIVQTEIYEQKLVLKEQLQHLLHTAENIEAIDGPTYEALQNDILVVTDILINPNVELAQLEALILNLSSRIDQIIVEIDQRKNEYKYQLTLLLEQALNLEALQGTTWQMLQARISEMQQLLDHPQATIAELEQNIAEFSALINQVVEETNERKLQLKADLALLVQQATNLEIVNTRLYTALQSELLIVNDLLAATNVTIVQLEDAYVIIQQLVEEVIQEITDRKLQYRQQLLTLIDEAENIQVIASQNYENLLAQIQQANELLQQATTPLMDFELLLDSLTAIIETVRLEVEELNEQLNVELTALVDEGELYLPYLSSINTQLLDELNIARNLLAQSDATIAQIEEQIIVIQSILNSTELLEQLKVKLEQYINTALSTDLMRTSLNTQLTESAEQSIELFQNQLATKEDYKQQIEELDNLTSLAQQEFVQIQQVETTLYELINEAELLFPLGVNIFREKLEEVQNALGNSNSSLADLQLKYEQLVFYIEAYQLKQFVYTVSESVNGASAEIIDTLGDALQTADEISTNFEQYSLSQINDAKQQLELVYQPIYSNLYSTLQSKYNLYATTMQDYIGYDILYYVELSLQEATIEIWRLEQLINELDGEANRNISFALLMEIEEARYLLDTNADINLQTSMEYASTLVDENAWQLNLGVAIEEAFVTLQSLQLAIFNHKKEQDVYGFLQVLNEFLLMLQAQHAIPLTQEIITYYEEEFRSDLINRYNTATNIESIEQLFSEIYVKMYYEERRLEIGQLIVQAEQLISQNPALNTSDTQNVLLDAYTVYQTLDLTFNEEVLNVQIEQLNNIQ